MTTGCSVTHLKKKGGAPKVRKVFDGAHLIMALFAVVAAVAGYGVYQTQANEIALSEVALANVEALATGEGPTSLGCKPYDGATCYIFDGNGQLVDKRKNQYPGQ